MATQTQAGQFQKLVSEATRCWHMSLSRYAESHLVGALITHMRDVNLFIFATSRLVALLQDPRPLAASFIINGDRCLLLVGLFPDQIVRRKLSMQYYTSIGRTYYAQAMAREPKARGVYYQSIINEFEAMVRTLQIMRAQH